MLAWLHGQTGWTDECPVPGVMPHIEFVPHETCRHVALLGRSV
jgi:hypothetical protein